MSVNDEFTDSSKETEPFECYDDEELANAGKVGSHEARNVLYMRHGALIKRLGSYAKKILRIAIYSGRVNVIIDGDDIEQQAFVVFCELLASWEPQSELFMKYLKRRMPWRLREYVHDTLVSRRGDVSQKTLPLEVHGDGDELYLLPRMNDDVDGTTQWGDHIKSLPFDLRATLKLRYYDDLTSAQIADLTGHTRREVDKTLHSAIVILRRELQERWEGT